MDEQQLGQILDKFSDFLEISNPISYMLKTIGWYLVKGLAWLVDSLANITDEMLGLKKFFEYTEVTSFVKTLIPLAVVLMGFSLLYTGYKLIFQKKIDREAVLINVFLIMFLFALLGEGMGKVNKFTDSAIDAIDVKEEGSISQKIVKDNITDLAQFDRAGWRTTELKHPNRIRKEKILKINITEEIDRDFKFDNKKELSDTGKQILNNKVTYGDTGNSKLSKLESGWFKFDERYYRYKVNWFTAIVTLGITAFTMLTIAIKLAKLFFELTFNYVLVVLIAPSDIHSGQKTKEVLQSILNIFLVTIMIFLSMKIYLMGTNFITDTLDGLAYLIALFAFSLAVIDGPNIVERLFGIDAGLKSSGLSGAYAKGKQLSQGLQSAGKGLQRLSSAGKSSALKGINGVAGVAGMAQGLKSKRQQGQGQQASNGNSQEYQSAKGQEQNSQSSGSGAEEITSGMQEVASSKSGAGGLHEEMAAKGFSSNGKRSAAANSLSPSGSSSLSVPSVPSRMQGKIETRHLGQVVGDRVRNNPNVKTVQQSYQIGKNTGESLRQNIANYRKKNGK